MTRKILAPLAMLALGAASAQDAETSADAVGEKVRWSRFLENAHEAKLQTPIVRYTNAEGVEVDLIGAIHVGDSAYYEKLNGIFTEYDVVLYELVSDKERIAEITGKADGHEEEADEAEDAEDGNVSESDEASEEGEEGDLADIGMNAAGAVQFGMASALNLKHQVDVIDYSAENFVHADMDPSMYKDKKKEKGETFLLFLIRAYKHQFELMRKGDTSGQVDVFSLIGNMFKHDTSTALKLAMARSLHETDGMTEAIEGKSGSVILAERNKYALDVLRKTLPDGHRKIGIFYGAAHLEGMDRILVEEMAFERGETDWVTAWHISLKKKGKKKAPRFPTPSEEMPENP